MEITKVTARVPVVSGKAFTLVIEHTIDCEGESVGVHVLPSDIFGVDPRAPKLGAGASTEVQCTVTRNKPASVGCSIEVTLGESVRVDTVEVP